MSSNNMWIFGKLAVGLTALAAYFTHLWWSLSMLTSGSTLDEVTIGDIALVFLGILAPPVGVIHGFVLWF